MPARDDHPECDFAGRPEACWALTWGNPRPCEQIRAGHCGFRRQIWRASTPEPAPFACPGDPAPEAVPAQEHVSPAPVPKAVSFAVVNCPARGIPVECGCALEHRYCGETLDLVTFDACVACRRAAQESASAAESPATDPQMPN